MTAPHVWLCRGGRTHVIAVVRSAGGDVLAGAEERIGVADIAAVRALPPAGADALDAGRLGGHAAEYGPAAARAAAAAIAHWRERGTT